jgi:hypothetical protein
MGCGKEPSREVLLEHGNIAHIRSIGEEKDEAGQRRYPVGLAMKCRTLLVRYEK